MMNPLKLLLKKQKKKLSTQNLILWNQNSSQKKLDVNEYIIKKIEGRLRREKALSYAETIKKPSVTYESNLVK